MQRRQLRCAGVSGTDTVDLGADVFFLEMLTVWEVGTVLRKPKIQILLTHPA